MNNLNQAKLNSAAGTIGSLIRAIPLGTATIMLLVSALQFIALFTKEDSFTSLFSLKGISWGIMNPIGLLFNQLINRTIWLYLLYIFVFPLAAAGVEQEVGTFQFLWLFQILGLITSALYILTVNLLFFFLPWQKDSVLGIDIAFFTFVTIEGLCGRGLYDIASRRGLVIAREFFFLPFLVIFMAITLFFGDSNLIPHILAAVVGCMCKFVLQLLWIFLADLSLSLCCVDYLGMLNAFKLSEGVINALETSGLFRWYCQRQTFVIKPGSVQLPMPGAFHAPDGYELL